MKRFLPYYSTERAAAMVYHVFEDCPIGARISKRHREPGVGAGAAAYEKCSHCQGWEDEIERARAECRQRWGLGHGSGSPVSS